MSQSLVVYSRQRCPLCDEGMAVVERVARRHRLDVKKVDVEEDPALHARYGLRVPVVELDRREVASGRIEEEALEAAIRPPGFGRSS